MLLFIFAAIGVSAEQLVSAPHAMSEAPSTHKKADGDPAHFMNGQNKIGNFNAKRSAALSFSGKIEVSQDPKERDTAILLRKAQQYIGSAGALPQVSEKGWTTTASNTSNSRESPTGLKIQESSDCSSTGSMVSGSGLNGDLNQGAGGKDIYLCKSSTLKFTALALYQSSNCGNGFHSVPTDGNLNGDLNEGAEGKDIYLCWKNEEGQPPITGIELSTSSTCETGYSPVLDIKDADGDLNRRAGGKDIFLCYTVKPNVTTAEGLYLQDHDKCSDVAKVKVTGDKDLNGDLNQDAGGKDIFLCQAASTDTMKYTSLILYQTSSCFGSYTPVAHSNDLNGDLNENAGGKDIFLCYLNQEGESKITGLKLAESTGTCPDGYCPVIDPWDHDCDLNRKAGGKDMILCYTKSGGATCSSTKCGGGGGEDGAKKLAVWAAFVIALLSTFF